MTLNEILGNSVAACRKDHQAVIKRTADEISNTSDKCQMGQTIHGGLRPLTCNRSWAVNLGQNGWVARLLPGIDDYPGNAEVNIEAAL